MLFSEHRLAYRTLKDINRQRIEAGVTPITSAANPTGQLTPTAIASNVAAQDAAHQAALQGNVGTAVGMTDAQVQQMHINQQNKDDANASLAGKGFSGSNTLYDPSLSAAQNAANEAASQKAGQSIGKAEAGLMALNILDPSQLADARNKDAQSRILQLQEQGLAQEQAQKSAVSNIQTPAPNSLNSFQNGAANVQAGVAGRLAARLDRQAFIEQKRAEINPATGVRYTDNEIRNLLNNIPPEQTGGQTSQQMQTSVPIAPDASTPQPPGAPKPDPSSNQPSSPDQNGATPPPVYTGSNLIRSLADQEVDPITKAILLAQADLIDANPQPGAAMGQADFNAGADAQAIASPYDAIQKILDKANTQATQSAADRKQFLDGQFARNEQYIAQQQSSQQQQLQFANDKAVRDQTDANKKSIDQQTIMLALGGGFGSQDGNSEIIQARLKGEQAIIDLNKEFGFKMTDASLQFTQMHNQAFDSYQTSWLDATDKFETAINNIDLQGISNQQAKGSAITGAYKDYVSEIKTARKDHATAINDATQMIYTISNNEKTRKAAEEKQSKADANGFFEFAFTQSTDPTLRQSAIDRMKAAGYDMPEGIDISADPIGFQLAAMNNAAKASINAASDPFRFTGEGAEEKQAISASALSVVGQLEGGVDLNRAQLNYVNQLIDRGDVEKAKEHLRGLAVASFNATQENLYSSRNSIATAGDSLVEDLRAIKDTSKGQTLVSGLTEAAETLGGKMVSDLTADDFTAYNKSIMSLKKKLGTETDEGLQRIFARVENIAGLIINERYGAAVTDGEMLRAQEYIPMSGNTLTEMIVKMEEFTKFSKMQNEQMINTKMGMPDANVDMNAPEIRSSPAIPQSDEDLIRMFSPDGGGGMSMNVQLPKEGGRLSTPYVSGIVTGYGSKYWADGVDISAPKGSPIQSPQQGVVEKVVYNPSWKGTPNNKTVGMTQNGGFGNQVVVKYNDGVKVQFSHLDKANVKQGQTIDPGTVFGFVGNTGNTYGPTGVHVDVTGYKPDGTRMTAKEVAAYMQSGNLLASASYRS